LGWTRCPHGTAFGIPRRIDPGETIRANRLRRMARQQGLDLRPSTRRDPRASEGTYALVEPGTDTIVAGFTLDRIEAYLLAALRTDAAGPPTP